MQLIYASAALQVRSKQQKISVASRMSFGSTHSCVQWVVFVGTILRAFSFRLETCSKCINAY